ncbi:phytanoyl-CoA dioxygenase family protein [Arenicellales bacterium nBUS_45]
MPEFYELTPTLAETFAEDGVVFIPKAIDKFWIDCLDSGIQKNINTPTERGRIWNRDDQGRTCFYDSQAWREIAEYRDFIENSPLASVAAQLLSTKRVNFFFDAVFVRTPGAQFRTPFHQDEPYWSVKGLDTCSIWMPLVSVEKKSALEFVRGSHRWAQEFRQTNFGDLTSDARDQRREPSGKDYEPFPDIEGRRDDYDILSWEMSPGDCVAFNGRTIHGGSGNLSPGCELRIFNTQWLGDDIRVCFREEGMDPDHSLVMREHDLNHGDRIGSDLYPEFCFD